MSILIIANTHAEVIQSIRQHVSDLSRHYAGLSQHRTLKGTNPDVVRSHVLKDLAASLGDVVVLPKRERSPSHD